jgi:predicted RNase H-like HicB family nuclease
MWLGYFEAFPDYVTQGEWLEELEDNLRDLVSRPGARHAKSLR